MVMVLVAILSLAYGTTQWVGLLVLVVVILGMQDIELCSPNRKFT
jgi:hypothetical protein